MTAKVNAMGSVKTEESDLLNNSKYRQYATAVDKALKAFEYTTEWADLIAALGKLNKVLLSNKKFGANIPKPVTVAKRLAQCLHPALPSGVHLKALEAYRHIFSLLGVEELPKVLHLFSVGLFPLLSYAGIKVKTELMSLYQEFLIPLGPKLKPACVGLLTGLLPGLEEGSEFYERSNTILEEILGGVGGEYFYTCLWQCIRCSPSVRLPALVFLSSHFHKGKAMDDQLFILGSSIDNMVSALCSAGTDGYALVQRHLLDFLCFAFPLDSEHLVKGDQVRLIQSTLFVLLRRDMSLNRRLYSWLIGGSGRDDSLDLTFFTKTSLPLISEAIVGLLAPHSRQDNEAAIRIARLYLYFLDKSELGIKVLEASFFRLLMDVEERDRTRTVPSDAQWRHHPLPLTSMDKKDEEFPKNLNLLLNCLDPGFIWGYVGRQLKEKETCYNPGSSRSCVCRVTRYLLGVVQLDAHTDIRSRQLPNLLLNLMEYAERSFEKKWKSEMFWEELREILLVSCELLREIQQASGAIELRDRSKSDSRDDDSDDSPSLDSRVDLISTRLVGTEGQMVVEKCLHSYLSLLRGLVEFCLGCPRGRGMSASDQKDLCEAAFALLKEFSDYPLCALLDTGSGGVRVMEIPGWVDSLMMMCLGEWACAEMGDFRVESGCLEVVLYMMVVSHSVVEQCHILKERQRAEETKGAETFHPVFLRPVFPMECLQLMELRGFYKAIAVRLWKKLGRESCKDNERAAVLFSSLHTCQLYASSYSDAEMVCLKDITSQLESQRCEAGERFHRFWSLCRNNTEELCPGVPQKPFSRVVLGLLSTLTTCRVSEELLSETAWRWLEDCLQHGDAPKLLQILCIILLHPTSSRISIQYAYPSAYGGRLLCRSGRSLQCLRSGGSLRLHHLLDSITPCGDLQPDSDWLIEVKRELLTEKEMGSPPPPTPTSGRWATSFDDDVDEPLREKSVRGKAQVIQQVLKEIVDKVCENVEFNDPIISALEEPSIGKEADEADTLSETDMAELGRGGEVDRSESLIGSPSLDVRFFDGVGEQKGVELRAGERGREASDLFHPLHAHFLLYTEGGQTELGKSQLIFRCLSALLKNPEVGRMLASSLASHATSSLRNSDSATVCGWMGRHVKTILGNDFWKMSDAAEGECGGTKHYMFLELFLTISLYYLRSYHLNNPVAAVSSQDLEANWRCKIACLEFLDSLTRKLNDLIEIQGNSFATYVGDVLMKCKFQKCLLHCMMASTQEAGSGAVGDWIPLSVDLARFNSGRGTSSPLLAAYQRSLLGLVSQVTELEFKLKESKTPGRRMDQKHSVVHQMSPLHSSLTTNPPLVELRLFLLTVLNALKRRLEMHEIWLKFIVSSLPYFQRSLPSLTLHLSEQLSKNLHSVTEVCYDSENPENGRQIDFPTNYTCILLEALMALFQHCLSESLPTPTSISIHQTGLPSTSNTGFIGATKNATGEIFTSLVKVFTLSEGHAVDATATIDKTTSFTSLARAELLGALPHILSTLCDVWSAVKKNKEPLVPVGLPQHVRRLILDLLSPISVNHSSHFLSSLALVWLTKGSKKNKNVPYYSNGQLDMADLLLSIKMFPFESLLSAASHTLKDPVRVKNIDEKDVFPIDVSLLEIVHGCLLSSPVALLKSSWTSVQKLLLDVQSLNLQPPALFMTFHILCDFVRKCVGGGLEDGLVLRGMQDVCIRITESLNSVVGWQLEQPTWLKRTLVVKTEADHPAGVVKGKPVNGFVVHSPTTESLGSVSSGRSSSVSSDAPSTKEQSMSVSSSKKDSSLFSTQALSIIADNLSMVIDMICKSEDKDRLLPTLHAVWGNVQPYLKTRNEKNARNFLAASKFLAGLSQFSYSRGVWKKGTMELLTDTSFFRMDVESLRCWLTIVDNLMTQDKTSFKDLLGKISLSQGPSLFTSKDQECEMRAGSLKRLAFVLLSSEVDQYQSHMPDIQERLTENLRLFQVPHVHAQVFLCVRVLLVRLSPGSLTSLWPVLVTELLQVLLQIEQDLVEAPHINNDYRCARDDQWHQLYLSVCKLLDALCTLPSWHLAQFQLFQWVFASAVENESRRDPMVFVPHIKRINELMKRKYGVPRANEFEGAPLLSQIRSISQLKDLRFFFHDFSLPESISRKGLGSPSPLEATGSHKSDSALKIAVEKLESSLCVDFLENWR